MSEVMNGVMGKLNRYGLRESVKGARIDCMISVDGHASDCMDITPSGPNVFSRAVLHALEKPEVQFKPMALNGSAVAGRHVFGIDVRARRVWIGHSQPFNLNADPGVPVPVESLPNYHAPSPTKEGNTPAGAIFYGLATVPSNYPSPTYPYALADRTMAGEARAVCTIQLDGRLADCRILSSTGSPAFGASLITWLTTPGLLAHPLLLDGAPVVGTREFGTHFKVAGRQ